MIKNILFDNNGVLTTTESNRLKDMASFLNTSEQEFIKIWKEEAKPLDDGRINTDQFLANVASRFGFSGESLEEISEIYFTFYEREDEMHEIVQGLGKKYTVALLSNFGDSFDKFEERWRTHETLDNDKMFVSVKVGMRKPNHDFYLYALNKLNAKPEETVFVDDREENIKAAEELGIKGILFRNKKQFLRAFNRIIDEENEK